ncbi:VOC family protein [Gordonia sp. Z-3]|uniref:VOC family protein n=2 Tax=Gordonia TaxID=2053 RepID=A0A9X3I732_9ACTN|nr:MULTISPECIES: VOC family protein [Gordonia]MAU80670.1 hypothetical protein [Gordonia sp. (in: high G+C Gram-positive bacteria)]MCF3940866.1 VOC family protein [Gordonia tangerina]MCX2966911.1 VOC family protein [Gordonia aquimaris]MED5803953.1 VOC family protein [Gordonia sp. Z-3]
MRIRWLTAFLDFPSDQFGAEVTFWRAIAGSTVSPPRGEHREFASLEPFNGDPHLRVQRIDEGPGGIHLDLHVDDLGAATDEAIRLGANILRSSLDTGWVSLTSPAGFVFCLVAWQGESVRSRPIRWPGDTISIIDQVCIDVPHGAWDREIEFWSAITGRPTTPTSRPELVRLSRDPALAIGILLQRNGPDDPSQTASGHLDLAANAVEDEVARHEDWGAEVVERLEQWTVMRDPVGRRYCITNRNPRTGD